MLSVSEVIVSKTFEHFDVCQLRLVLLEHIVVLEYVIRPNQPVVERYEVVDGDVDGAVVVLIAERLFLAVYSHVILLTLEIEGLELPVQVLLEELLGKVSREAKLDHGVDHAGGLHYGVVSSVFTAHEQSLAVVDQISGGWLVGQILLQFLEEADHKVG